MTIANGGTIVYTDSDGLNPSPTPTVDSVYKVHIFTSSGDLEVIGGGLVDYLIVAGGGAGGNGNYSANEAGGGGAGGLLTGNSSIAAGTFPVVIGAGGRSGPFWESGGNSSFNSLTAIGGGRGGSNSAGGNGGSGGGGTYNGNSGGSGTVGQGHDGEGYDGHSPHYGGGGGGAGTGGGELGGKTRSYGGDGLQSSLSGTPTYYAGGGGGVGWSGDSYYSGLGGLGGGGNSASAMYTTGYSGTPNTGGGGGGGCGTNLAHFGGDGGSGIVIVRYLYQGEIVYTDSDGLNPTTAPDANSVYKVHIFKSSGNLVLSEEKSVDYLIVGGGGAGGVFGGGANTSIDYHVHAGGSGTVGQGNNGGSTPGYSGSALYAAMAVTDDIYKPSFSIDYIHIGYTPSPTTETTVAMAFNEVAFGVLTNVNVSVNS